MDDLIVTGEAVVRLRYTRTMIRKEVLDAVVCPVCRQPLTYREESDTLKCAACRRVYPIQDDIPVLLLDEAKFDG